MIKYYFIFFFILLGFGASAQIDTLPVCYIEDEQIIVEFDIRDYPVNKQSEFTKIFEIEDVDVFKMVEQQTETPQNGWQLKKVNQHVYQLCKKLDAFSEAISWKSKYLIDGSGWASPTSELSSNDTFNINQAFDFNQTIAVVSDSGNVDFRLKGYKFSKKVILAGSFNGWNEQAIQMRRDDEGWFTRLQLPSGIYEYKFIVDEKWMHDPVNKLMVQNEHETWNSILLVGELMTFRLPEFANAKNVILSGSFNSWNEEGFPMKKEGDAWVVQVPLPPGKHYYKFIIDGEWITDPANKLMQADGYGHWNSVLLIH